MSVATTKEASVDLLVSVAVILNNDGDLVEAFLAEATDVLSREYAYYELLLIDNGSTDGGGDRVQALQKDLPNIRLIRLSRAYDDEVALAAALDNVIGDYVIIMEPECDPPSMIPRLVAIARTGYDVVTAARTDRKRESRLRSGLRRLSYHSVNRIFGYTINPTPASLRLFSRQVVNSITRIRSKSRYLKYFSALVGFRHTQVPYQAIQRRTQRAQPESLLRLGVKAVDLLISNSMVPLRIASLLALFGSFINLLYLVYIFIFFFLLKKKAVEGWLSTSLSHTAMFMLLFLVVTVMSEYVGRILEESKERPLYFIEQETASAVTSYSKERLNVI
jgi:glycosyltransferase involved in cell wall biosynthesis